MANYKNPMNIIEALVQLRDDIKLWVANNLRTKLDKNLGTDNSGKVLSVDSDGNIVPTEADLGGGIDYSDVGLTEEEKSRLIKMQLDAPVILNEKFLLDWNTVYGANKYYIYSTDLPVNVDETGLVAAIDNTATEFNLSSTMETQAIPAGDYSFYVIAGDGETPENRSAASNIVSRGKAVAPTVSLNGNIVSWDASGENFTYVVLALNSAGNTTDLGTLETTIDGKNYSILTLFLQDTSYTLSSEVFDDVPDIYSIYVRAMPQGTSLITMSNLSEPVYYTVTGEEES
jgi:hypothetical protein